MNLADVPTAGCAGFAAWAAATTSRCNANQVTTQPLIERIDKHSTIASTLNLSGPLVAFPIRKIRAESTNAAYTEDLDLEDTLNSTQRLRD